MSALAPTLEGFFTERLINQKRASDHTITAYRDTFRLLLGFVQRRTGKAPSDLGFDDVDATVIGAFLDHLEAERHNSVRTRNSRLAAIRSMFRYAALHHPEHAALIGRVLASQPNAPTAPTCRSWTIKRSTLYSPPPTSPAGSVAATTRCWPRPSRPGCESRS